MESLATSPAMDQQGTAVGEAHAIDSTQKIIEALHNPEYSWRTVDGIARETHLSVTEVLDTLMSTLADKVVRSSIRDDRGRALFTARDRYKRQRSFVSSVLTALSDQIK